MLSAGRGRAGLGARWQHGQGRVQEASVSGRSRVPSAGSPRQGTGLQPPYPRRPAGCAPSPRSAAGGDARWCAGSSTRLRGEGPGAGSRGPSPGPPCQHSPPSPVHPRPSGQRAPREAESPRQASLSPETRCGAPAPHKQREPPEQAWCEAEEHWLQWSRGREGTPDPRRPAAQPTPCRAQQELSLPLLQHTGVPAQHPPCHAACHPHPGDPAQPHGSNPSALGSCSHRSQCGDAGQPLGTAGAGGAVG